MKIFANPSTKRFFFTVTGLCAAFAVLTQGIIWMQYEKISVLLLLLTLLFCDILLTACFLYFRRQDRILEAAVNQINAYLDGDLRARIDCDEEGELYRLFHSVNTLAAVLNAHADNELREKQFLKNTISDISHQLKTPLAALNIYNGLIQGEAAELSSIQELAGLSEQEFDRMETLVQNLLKITKLNAGSIQLEKKAENVGDLLRDVELHFAYRARQEQKAIVLSGSDEITLFCDRDWLMEALNNIVKNALDHTKAGDTIEIAWKQFASVVQIAIKDNGCGIHPEDLPHIFKRFYRSRFSQDAQGIGLGLPLAKEIVEAHNGSIEVDSELGKGTVFTINFLISPIITKL